MPTILAPAPRLPPQLPQLLAHDLSPDVFLAPCHPRPPRLLSPIRLHDLPLNPKSPTPCGPSHKRRSSSRLLARSSRRRRHVQRVESPLEAFGRPSVLDQLPFVSALEMPGPVNSDIADLSQLPLDEDPLAFSDTVPASGPVRRRKTSLRSNPLGNGHEPPPSVPLIWQHPPLYRSIDSLPDCPRTPPPLVPFDPSKITFHHLMPVFPCGVKPSTPF